MTLTDTWVSVGNARMLVYSYELLGQSLLTSDDILRLKAAAAIADVQSMRDFIGYAKAMQQAKTLVTFKNLWTQFDHWELLEIFRIWGALISEDNKDGFRNVQIGTYGAAAVPNYMEYFSKELRHNLKTVGLVGVANIKPFKTHNYLFHDVVSQLVNGLKEGHWKTHHHKTGELLATP